MAHMIMLAACRGRSSEKVVEDVVREDQAVRVGYGAAAAAE